MNAPSCICLEASAGLNGYSKTFVGIDKTNGRLGEVELWTCKRCGQIWLRYAVEYEGFSNSGRWFRGKISAEQAKGIKPESAANFFHDLDWYYAGGSYFGGMPGKRSGGPLIDL